MYTRIVIGVRVSNIQKTEARSEVSTPWTGLFCVWWARVVSLLSAAEARTLRPRYTPGQACPPSSASGLTRGMLRRATEVRRLSALLPSHHARLAAWWAIRHRRR
jgi:hypothetical protein